MVIPIGLRIARYESVPTINLRCLFPRQFAEAIHVFQFHVFFFLRKNNFISSAHASPYARSLWEISWMKCHSSSLSTIYYCIVARTIDKSTNTLCSFTSVLKWKCAFFHYFDKKSQVCREIFCFSKQFSLLIYCTSILHILTAYFSDFCNLFRLKNLLKCKGHSS